MTAARGGLDLLRKMLAHYRMLRFLRRGRWRSVKATIRTFWNLYVIHIDIKKLGRIGSVGHRRLRAGHGQSTQREVRLANEMRAKTDATSAKPPGVGDGWRLCCLSGRRKGIPYDRVQRARRGRA
jgi:hypothetical protein